MSCWVCSLLFLNVIKHIDRGQTDNVGQEWVSRLIRQLQKSQYKLYRNQKGLSTEGRKIVLSVEGKVCTGDEGWWAWLIEVQDKDVGLLLTEQGKAGDGGWRGFHSLILKGVGLRWSVGLGIWSPVSRCLDRRFWGHSAQRENGETGRQENSNHNWL